MQIRDARYTRGTPAAEQVNAWFKRLQQIDNNDWRPAALWALRNHGDDPAWLDRFFGALERLAASMFIRRVYTTPRVTRYADLLRELDAGKSLDATSFDPDGHGEGRDSRTAGRRDIPRHQDP